MMDISIQNLHRSTALLLPRDWGTMISHLIVDHHRSEESHVVSNTHGQLYLRDGPLPLLQIIALNGLVALMTGHSMPHTPSQPNFTVKDDSWGSKMRKRRSRELGPLVVRRGVRHKHLIRAPDHVD